jgi:predicted nucleotidyltransferase
MNLQEALTAVVTRLETVSSVQGAFLSGSLVNEYQDEYSDIDLGIATGNSAKAFNNAFTLRHELLAAVGQPLHSFDRGWGHCKMIAALFGKSQFPPIGLEIDIIFSQLRYVSEQMPYSEYRIILDRNGKLQPALAEMSQPKTRQEIESEIISHLKWFPFYVHDALTACKRGDEFQVQSLLEEIRKLVFFAAAARYGKQVYGSKRAYRYLSTYERPILEDAYRRSDEDMVGQLAEMYFECLMELKLKREIRDIVENTRTILRELL